MYRSSVVPPLRLVFLMWLTYSIELSLHIDLGFLGIQPRSVSGLVGILTAPLIHGNISHLISNTFPLLFLGATLYLFYDRIATHVLFQCYLFTNFLVWIFGRPYFHIGASGLVYGLAAFLIFFGLFRRNIKSILISIVIMALYGGLWYGVLPQDTYISWESHLMGAVVGIGSALGMSKVKHVSS